MTDDELVKIKNIKQMSKHIGKDIARNLSIPIKEMKNYIKPSEIRSIIEQYSVEKNDDYLINPIILQKIFLEVNNWVLGIKLSKLASRGELEAFWDNEQNCMIFEAQKGEKNG